MTDLRGRQLSRPHLPDGYRRDLPEAGAGDDHRVDELGPAGLAAALTAMRNENDQLRQAMATRAVIEQAKGALMLRYAVTSEQAFGVLVRWSRTSNVKLHTVAQALLDAVASGRSVPSASTQDVSRWLHVQAQNPAAQDAAETGP